MPAQRFYLSCLWLVLFGILSAAEAKTPYIPRVNSDFSFVLRLEDRDGHLWFSDPDQGFVEYDGANWWLYHLPPQAHPQATVSYQSIAKNSDGELYFEVIFRPNDRYSMHGYPAYYTFDRDANLSPVLKPESTPCYTLQNPGNDLNSVNCELLFDKKNRLLLALSKLTVTPKQDFAFQFDHYLQEGSRWITLLDKYRLSKAVSSHLGAVTRADFYYSLHIDRQNRLWLSFGSKVKPEKSLLVMIDRQEKVHLYPDYSLLLEDSHGTLWSRHQAPGKQTRLRRLNPGLVWVPAGFASVPAADFSLLEDQTGNLWAVTLRNEIYQKDHQTWKKIYSVSKPIRALAFDKTNRLWISTGNELIRYHQGRQSSWKEVLFPEAEADLHPTYSVYSIFVDQSDTKWFQFTDDHMPGLERTYHKTPLKFDNKHWQYLWTSPLLDAP